MSDLIPISFRGVDEGADPKAQPPGTLLRAENCAMDKARRLTKRAGTTSLVKTRVDSGSVTTGKRLIAYPNGDFAIYDGEYLFNRIKSTGQWSYIERPTPLSVESRPFIDATLGIIDSDFIIYGDLMFVVYQVGERTTGSSVTAGKIYFRVDNLVTGQCVQQPELITVTSGYAIPKIVLGATKAFITFAAPNTIYAVGINLTTFNQDLPTEISVGSDAYVLPVKYDVAIGTSSAGEVLYVAYRLAAGASRLKVRSWTTAALAADQNYTVAGSGTAFTGICLAWCPLANKVGLVFCETGGPTVYAIVLTRDLAVSTALTAFGYAYQTDHVFCAEYDATHMIVGFDSDTVNTISRPWIYSGLADFATLTVPAGTTRATPHLTKPSRPWKHSDRWYIQANTACHGTGASSGDYTPQESSIIVELTFDTLFSNETYHRQMATLENLTSHRAASLGQNTLVKACVDADGNYWTHTPYKYREPLDQYDDSPTGRNLHKITRYGHDHFGHTQIGPGVLVAGASTLWLDGAGAMPYGFQFAPKVNDLTAVAGGAMVAGSYTYVACFAWMDACGLLHRSVPSPVSAAGTTAGGNLTLEVKVTTCTVSCKQQLGYTGNSVANPVEIELYRTPVGGTVHYKHLDAYQRNDPSLRYRTMTDTRSDANIDTNSNLIPLTKMPVVYTETGELANIPAPASIACTTHRGRLVLIDSTKRGVWFSKDWTEDPRIAPGFNEVLYLGFAFDKLALKSMDDKLVVLGDTIDVVHGAGPDATGAGEWQVQQIQTDAQCINARSVVGCPAGVMFESSRGLELLGRDLTVTWKGKAVEDTLALYPTITSAVLVPDAHEIRFTCNEADGSNGIVLAWDYTNDFWFVRKYKDAADTNTVSCAFVDAVLAGGVYTLMTAGGQVYQETSSHKLDNGTTFVARDILTAPMSFGGPMAWGRVKDISILGTGVTDHDMTISIARDYATSFEQTKTFLAGTPPVTAGPLTKCRITLKYQQLRAVQVRIQDVTPTAPGVLGNGDASILEGLAVRFTPKLGKVARTKSTEQA